MKKLIFSVFILVAVTGTAFSSTPVSVDDNVMATFKISFANAKNVQWVAQKDFVKATFVQDGQTMFAYFKTNGELMAVTRNLTLSQLPLNLSVSLRAKFADSWMTQLFEVSANGSTLYYVTIQNATHTTILKADTSANWTVYRKEKRDGQ